MKFKRFQKQDLARAALHDGLILSWDTGMGKSIGSFAWPLLKVGFLRFQDPDGTARLRPGKPVLLICPGDLHQQITDEGWQRFRIRVVPLTTQNQFMQLTRKPGTLFTNLSPDGRPILEPEFYLTSYTQLATNGVQSLPDPYDWDDPRALLELLCLEIGQPKPEHSPNHKSSIVNHKSSSATWPDFANVCHFFAWRELKWRDHYSLLMVDPNDTLKDLQRAYDREIDGLASWHDRKSAETQRLKLTAAYEILKQLMPVRDCPGGVKFSDLQHLQQNFVIREFCAEKIQTYTEGYGESRKYEQQQDGTWKMVPEVEDSLVPSVPSACRRVKCLYSPSLADLAYNAFDCVVIDEGVKMKGEETLVGKGVRSMTPRYRLVLTATPVKNRLPDIFRLAWWATGGKTEAHARWPYRDDTSERTKFAETFMVSERNVTKEANARAEGKPVPSGRFKKLTAEVCNIHRLWKLLGPVTLRRRKDDAGEDIVPKIRKVIRCELGTLQKKVYQYHINADYRDKNGLPATGAQLQALRMAAADPSSEHLQPAGGEPTEPCECTRNAERGTRNAETLPSLSSLSSLPQSTINHQPSTKCKKCNGSGVLRLPHRSGQAYIPKMASTLQLIEEILARREQVVVFSAFNDPLDNLARWLDDAGVRHIKLDGRTSQKARGKAAALFKQGRFQTRNAECGTRNGQPSSIPILPSSIDSAIPVMLAGVECMAEGHSFHLANNVILIAYSWAYDKFIQAINRVHRMTSSKPVNVYVVICQGTIDRKLESLIQDKGDAAELVLDGRLIGERTEEVNLAELLQVAQREFNSEDNTLDEALLQRQWPALRDRLSAAAQAWTDGAPVKEEVRSQKAEVRTTVPRSALRVPRSPRPVHRDPNPETETPMNPQPQPQPPKKLPITEPTAPVEVPIEILPQPSTPQPPQPSPSSANDWRARMQARAGRLARIQKADVWSQL